MNAKTVASMLLSVTLAGCSTHSGGQPTAESIRWQQEQEAKIQRDFAAIDKAREEKAREQKRVEEKPDPTKRQPGRDYYEDFTTWAERDAYAMRQYNCHPIKHFEGKEYGIPAGGMVCVIFPRAIVSLYGSGKLASAYFVYLPRYDYGEFAINTTVNCENNLAWDNIVGTPGSRRSAYYYPAEAVRGLCDLVWGR